MLCLFVFLEDLFQIVNQINVFQVNLCLFLYHIIMVLPMYKNIYYLEYDVHYVYN